MPIEQNAKPDVPLGRLMRFDMAKRVLKDHNACQARLGPFDDPCYEPGPSAMMPQRAAKLDRQEEWSPSMVAQRVQRGHHKLRDNQPSEPKESGPMPMEAVEQDLQP